MEEGEGQSSDTTSLFPAFLPSQSSPPNPSAAANANVTSAAGPAANWLQNSSFTTDLSVINEAVTKYELPFDALDDEEQLAEEIDANKQRGQYEMLASSASDEDASEGEGRKERKKKKKRKRREAYSEVRSSAYDYPASLSSSRKPGVQKWASSATTPGEKEYFFDSRGDRDNLAFGSVYRQSNTTLTVIALSSGFYFVQSCGKILSQMDVALYKLYNSKEVSESSNFRRFTRVGGMEGDEDIDWLDSKLKSGGRYWSAKYSVVERHKNLKRVRILLPTKHIGNMVTDFIPLSADEDSGRAPVLNVTVVEESWEDEVLRKTKEFNTMTRERPQDESVWLAFAAFQDKVSRMQPHKGARLQTLEKKISILEKATEFNPDSEDLLLALLYAYQTRDNSEVLIRRWERILVNNSGSYKLWREFLRVFQGEFSRFKVSDMRKIYRSAIQALSSACIKQHRQAFPSGNETPVDPSIVQLELGLVDIFLSLCRLEWQAGYQELATALFQAEIEYTLFSPSLVLSEQSKQRLFEHFWSSNGARIGEDGAFGWSTWLEKEEEQRQRLISEETSTTADEGGWTGWFDPISQNKEIDESPVGNAENDIIVGEFDDESDARDVDQKDDIESLLKELGIDAAAEDDIKVKDTRTWTNWSRAELARDFDQWMPLNSKSADGEDNEQLFRTILYEDVCDYLFSLKSEESRMSLVAQFIDFYEGRIAQWTGTNSPSWVEKTLSLETLPYSILENLKRVHDVLTEKRTDSRNINLELLMNSSNDKNVRSDTMKFLRNATLLCLQVFPQNYMLQEAALVAEELSTISTNTACSSVTPCRALAKTLLKNNRQDVLLCGVYAQREARFGNDDRPKAPLLYFWYAEMELSNDNAESSSRATHILSCLGSGASYSPSNGQPSALQKLRARQGFKDQIKKLDSLWARGFVDDPSAAVICSAALFEELTSGWTSALEILEHSFTMVLPERRRQCRQLEFLMNYYVRMLRRNHVDLKISKVWEAITKGLQLYPFNPPLHNALVEISNLYTSPNKLRWTFDDYFHKKASVITWLYALSFEMSAGGSKHRIRGLFERALEDGKLQNLVILWRCYLEYEMNIACNFAAAKRVFFRAIHACPWSKKLWLDGFLKLDSILTVKELSDLQEVMRDKELNLRTDIYEILLEDDMDV
ncbi:hypothetical protein F511_18033 [Dorcoceras hygrometricum]|uniref:Protein NRDE2 n=1 Tax=Dorcoceras hygrometricum TaxID=472368 RepID=A0A2Z7C0W4_9LAMI|nr:hypothetical protein F511_18033 [Dorcoceras hygrometricum]